MHATRFATAWRSSSAVQPACGGDPSTMTPARARALASAVIRNWVEKSGQQLVTRIRQESPGGLAATGLAACLTAVRQHAVHFQARTAQHAPRPAPLGAASGRRRSRSCRGGHADGAAYFAGQPRRRLPVEVGDYLAGASAVAMLRVLRAGSKLSGSSGSCARGDWSADLTPAGPGCRRRASCWRRVGGDRLACGDP